MMVLLMLITAVLVGIVEQRLTGQDPMALPCQQTHQSQRQQQQQQQTVAVHCASTIAGHTHWLQQQWKIVLLLWSMISAPPH